MTASQPNVRVLVIGLGSIGRRHVSNLHALGVRDFIAWRSGRGERTDLEVPVVSFSELDEALAMQPAVAIIANPTRYHVSAALRIARAGCPFFLEKPLSDSLDGLDALLELVSSQSLLTMIGFNLRFHPALITAKRLIEEGSIGRVLYLRAEVGQYLPDWRPEGDYRTGYSARRELGGGVVLDLIHEMDYANWLAGPMTAATCLAARVSDLDIETEDIAEFTLRFASGGIGSVHMDYLQRAPHRECRVVGESGTLVIDLLKSEVRLYQADRGQWQIFENLTFKRNDMYLAQMKHLLTCLQGRDVPPVDLASAMPVHRVTFAALEEARRQ